MKFLQDERDQISAALVVFHSNVRNIPKSEKNPFYNSSYADMATVMRHIGPALEAAKLAVIQGYVEPDLQQPNAQAMIETLVLHESGQGFASYVPCVMPYQWNKAKGEHVLELGPQASGKTQTYARRYGLMAALCLAAGGDDDDGESGQDRYRDEDQPTPQANPGPRTGVKGNGNPHDVRQLKANFPSTCPLCQNGIAKGEAIAWRKDEEGRSRVAHWTCYQSWKAGDEQTPPVDDEAALHANAPDEDALKAAEDYAADNPPELSTDQQAELDRANAKFGGRVTADAKKKTTAKKKAATKKAEAAAKAEAERQAEEQQEADDSDLPF